MKMMYLKRISMILILTSSCLVSLAYADESHDLEKTLSPYFFVKSRDAEVDQLPLKATEVKASVAGVIADVLVTQVYENKGSNHRLGRSRQLNTAL